MEILEENELLLATTVVDRIIFAIDKDISLIKVGTIVLPSREEVLLRCSSWYFLETLKLNLDKLIKHEEYELCAKVKKYIDILESRENVPMLMEK